MSIDQNELRRLQELAAKANGLAIRGYDYGSASRHACVLIDTGAREPSRWAPWFNDGDAFRLLVDLGLHASAPRSPRESASCNHIIVGGAHPPRALLRMAVTRAAAAEAERRGPAA